MKNLTVQRQDRANEAVPSAAAVAQVQLQLYRDADVLSDDPGLWATIKSTTGQGISGLTWSLQMLVVGVAFSLPWILLVGMIGFLVVRISRRK